MRDKTLNIYLNGVLVGKLVQGQYGRLSFTYAPEFLNQAITGISLSLPLQEKPFEDGVVRAFFSGLLPDEKIRQRLAAYLGLSNRILLLCWRQLEGNAPVLYPYIPKNNDHQVIPRMI